MIALHTDLIVEDSVFNTAKNLEGNTSFLFESSDVTTISSNFTGNKLYIYGEDTNVKIQDSGFI